MSPSAVPRAAKQGSHSLPEAAATAPEARARCFRRYAPRVAKKPKYPLNLVVIDRFTVAIATVKSERAGNAVV